MVSVTRLVGDDITTETRMDRSWLVNASGTVGFLYESGLVPIVVAGVLAATAVPSVVHKLEEAQKGASNSQVKADIVHIEHALHMFAIRNGGRYPDSLEALITPDVNGATFLDSTELPRDPWGAVYMYSAPDEENPEPCVWCASDEFMY